MATKQLDIQQNLVIAESIEDPEAGYVGFGAKADGIHQRLPGGEEHRILTTNDYWQGTKAELDALDLISPRIAGKFYYQEEE